MNKFDHDEQILSNHATLDKELLKQKMTIVIDKHLLTAKKVKRIEKEAHLKAENMRNSFAERFTKRDL